MLSLFCLLPVTNEDYVSAYKNSDLNIFKNINNSCDMSCDMTQLVKWFIWNKCIQNTRSMLIVVIKKIATILFNFLSPCLLSVFIIMLFEVVSWFIVPNVEENILNVLII